MADEQSAENTQDTSETPDIDALQAKITELTEANMALTEERDGYQATLQLAQDDVTAKEQALSELTNTLTAKEQAFTELSNMRTKENMLIDAGLPRTLAANITGETKEDWEKSVKVFSDLKASGEKPKRDPAQSADNTPTSDPSTFAREFFASFFND